MTRFSTLLRRLSAAALLAGMLALGGCHMFGGGSKNGPGTAQMEQQFDTTIKAYKNGQFMLDGGVLSALDLGSHFAYLKDQGQLPKTVLLVASDDSKIRKQHLQYMARLQIDYGFTVYYDDDGQLKKINAVETKARALEDYHAPIQHSSDQGAGASGNPAGGAGGP